MGMWSRLKTIVKGNMNNAIDKIESPKLLNQYIADAESDLSKFKQDIKEHTANQFTLEQDLKYEREQIEKLETSAVYALEKNDEEKATSLLNDKLAREQKVIALEHEHQQCVAMTSQLISDYKQLETRLTQLRHRKDILLTQAHSSKARKRSYEIQQKVQRPEIGGDFDRMEQKVRRMQAEADAEGYINTETGLEKWDVTDVQVSNEIERLKAKLASKKEEVI